MCFTFLEQNFSEIAIIAIGRFLLALPRTLDEFPHVLKRSDKRVDCNRPKMVGDQKFAAFYCKEVVEHSKRVSVLRLHSILLVLLVNEAIGFEKYSDRTEIYFCFVSLGLGEQLFEARQLAVHYGVFLGLVKGKLT